MLGVTGKSTFRMNDKSALLNQLRIDRSSAPPPADRSWLKWLALAIVLLLLVALAGWWLSRPSGVPVKVVTAQALKGAGGSGTSAGASLLDASGYVVARRQATVAAKITGKVTEVLIEEGRHVKAGDVIGRLDDTNIRAAYDQATAQ